MNKNILLSIVVSVIALFLLQSCYTMGQKSPAVADEKEVSVVDQSGDETTKGLDEVYINPQLLGGKHSVAGVDCKDCHVEKPPAEDVPTSVCINCHGDFAEIPSQGYPDPHNSHMMYQECGDCHHSHKPSVNQCQGCHSFGFNIS